MTDDLLCWEAPWVVPPERLRVEAGDGAAWLVLEIGAVAQKSIRLELTAEQAQGLAMKLHEAALRLTLTAREASSLSNWVRDTILDATGARVPPWLRPG